jgi:hypothetical protein
MYCPRLNFKAQYIRRIFSRPIRQCVADGKQSIREFWCQLNVRLTVVIRYPFYTFALYATICSSQPPCITRATSVYQTEKYVNILNLTVNSMKQLALMEKLIFIGQENVRFKFHINIVFSSSSRSPK